jgi:hypothetical protein
VKDGLCPLPAYFLFCFSIAFRLSTFSLLIKVRVSTQLSLCFLESIQRKNPDSPTVVFRP